MERGDRVATLLPSLPETAAVFIGTYKRGRDPALAVGALRRRRHPAPPDATRARRCVVTDAANRHRIPDGMVER